LRYDRRVLRVIRRTTAGAAMAAIALVLCAAPPALASLRAAGSPRCTANGDWPAVRTAALPAAASLGGGDTLRRIVTLDFDHDGDLDVVAAGDRGVHVWLNDGAGHLIIQSPQSRSEAPWRTGLTADPGGFHQRSIESIQNDIPSFAIHSAPAHGPPACSRTFAPLAFASALRDAARGSLASRAPPL
jgi:hypothetical protein